MQFRTVSQPSEAQLDALIVPVFNDGDVFSGVPSADRETTAWVAREQGSSKLFSTATHLRQKDGGPATRLVVVAAGRRADYDLQRAWEIVSAGTRALLESTAKRIGVVLDTESLGLSEAVQAAVEGVHYALWRPDAHRTGAEDGKLPPIEEVLLIAGAGELNADDAIRRGTAIGAAVNWARTLANEPANLMTPTHVSEAATRLAADSGLKIDVLDEGACRELGMGSFLSVAHGSDEPAKFIVLRHQGRVGDGYDLGLVGKGITFDSGGISIKPADKMGEMKWDMMGAATAMGVVLAAADLRLGVNLVAVAALTENLPSGSAYKPGDIVRFRNGKTAEIDNTDAEGRIILADALDYAAEWKPAVILDYATLTGAALVALGLEAAIVFTDHDALAKELVSAGETTDERLWRLPMWEEYKENIRSDWADMKNTGGRWGGSINGAMFLKEFVDPKTPWAHLDIAGTAYYDRDYAGYPVGATSFGLGMTLRWLRGRQAGAGGGRRGR